MEKENIVIQHGGNGGELRINLEGRNYIKADGYCSETNTIYEFHGCFHHYDMATKCPFSKRYKPDDVHPLGRNGITYREKYLKTIQREQLLKDMGYNLVVIWYCEYTKGVVRRFD